MSTEEKEKTYSDFIWYTKTESDSRRFNKQSGIRVGDMETSHIFFTIRMLYNNTVKEKNRVGRVKLYRFGGDYSPSYLKEAINSMALEIFDRLDIAPWMSEELKKMGGLLKLSSFQPKVLYQWE